MRDSGLLFRPRLYRGINEPPEALYDVSRHGNDCSFKGSGEPDWVRLPSGLWVMSFDGSDDYIAYDAVSHSLLTDVGAMSVWFNVQIDQGAWYTTFILAVGYSSVPINNACGITYGQGGKLCCTNRWGGGDNLFYTGGSAGDIKLGNWYQAFLVQDGTGVLIYLNGLLHETPSSGTDLTAWTSSAAADWGVIMGQVTTLFGGMAALPTVYGYAPSADDIYSIYQRERGWFRNVEL